MSYPDTVTPVPVHVASIALEAGPMAPRRRRAIRTDFGNEQLSATNGYRPLLPESTSRVCAYLQAVTADVYLCKNETDARQVSLGNAVQGAILLPHANTAPWPVRGQNAMWIGADLTGSNTANVIFTADYETGDG